MADNLEPMQLFHRVARAINGSLNLDDTLEGILRALREALSVDAVAVCLLNSNADGFEVAASSGLSEPVLAQVPGMPAELRERILRGETVSTSAEELTQVPLEHIPRGFGLLTVPLEVRRRVIGVLLLFCSNACTFDKQALTMLHAIADLAAVAIENARLHTSLLRIAEALASSLELRPLLEQVLAATVMEMGLKAASVRLLDSEGKHLELVAAHGLSEKYLAKGPVTVSKSPIDQRLLRGEQVWLYDVSEDPGYQYPQEADAEGIRSVLAVPLRVKDRIVGVMRVYSAQPRAFTSIGVGFLRSVAGLVALAIENAKLYEALRARYEDLKIDVGEWYRFLALG